MPGRVDSANTILINSIRYPIIGPVRRFLASQPPPRLLVGEVGPRVGQGKSAVAWTDQRGGIGIERMDPARDVDRCWWSTLNLEQNRHLTLPRLATTTAASGVSGSFTVGFINERDNAIYAAFGTAVRSYTTATDSWGSTLRTLPAPATDSLNIRMGGTEYLVIAHTGGYTYFDGTTWTETSKATKYLVWWDDRLWGISSGGLLWSSGTIGVTEDDAQLPRPDGSVTNLFLGRSPGGDIVIYAATTEGLYVHDVDGKRWHETTPRMVRHPDNGLGADTWRDDSYISAGLGIFKRVSGENTSIVTVMGPDRDHGVPAAYRGTINALIPTHNHLVALLDSTTSPSAITRHLSGPLGNAEVVQPDVGRSAILAYDGRGWEVLWTSAADTLPITAGHVSNAYSDYRLWWAQNQRVSWMVLPRDVTNPNQISNQTYAASGTHEYPWFDADETHGDKLGLVVCLDVTGASATETVAVRRRLNNDDAAANQVTLGTVSASGHTEYLLPNATTPSGTTFIQWKLVLDLARGSNNTLSPDVQRVDFYFLRMEDVRWGAAVTVVIPPGGNGDASAEQMFDNLASAIGNVPLVEVVWRDRDANTAGAVDPYNYFMKIRQFTGTEETGHDFSGQFQVVAVQP